MIQNQDAFKMNDMNRFCINVMGCEQILFWSRARTSGGKAQKPFILCRSSLLSFPSFLYQISVLRSFCDEGVVLNLSCPLSPFPCFRRMESHNYCSAFFLTHPKEKGPNSEPPLEGRKCGPNRWLGGFLLGGGAGRDKKCSPGICHSVMLA